MKGSRSANQHRIELGMQSVSSPASQITWGLEYIRSRYSEPRWKRLLHRLTRRNWYAKGRTIR